MDTSAPSTMTAVASAASASSASDTAGASASDPATRPSPVSTRLNGVDRQNSSFDESGHAMSWNAL